jgi:hypothetical protein
MKFAVKNLRMQRDLLNDEEMLILSGHEKNL